MTQSALVIEVLGEKAKILVRRKTACGGDCASCGGCADKMEISVVAGNRAGAKVGDTVIVETQNSRVIGGAALVYIVPLVLTFAGYAAGAALKLPETGSVLCAFAGFGLGAAIAVLLGRRMKRADFEIVRICR